MEYLRAYVDAACAPEIGEGREFAYLKEALYAGLLGAGYQSPNPAVGALLVKDGEVIARAAHRVYGEEHAEAAALAMAKAKARGSSLFVTLEPCTHHGKQPPCADALLAAGVNSITYAGDDPDERTCRSCKPALEGAGLIVAGPLFPRASVRLNDVHYYRKLLGGVFVTLRLAVSLDGKLALSNGNSQWLTGKAARGYTHYLRQTHDAVLIGLGTARADNPRLTVRKALLQEFAGADAEYIRHRNPARVILDPGFELLKASAPPAGTPAAPALNIFAKPDSCRETIPWLIFVGELGKSPAPKGLPKGIATIELPPASGGRLEFALVWERLAELGISSVMVEGGADTARGVLSQRACVRLDVIVAPVLLGDDAHGYNAPLGLADLNTAPMLNDVVNLPLGRDTLVSGYFPALADEALLRMGRQ